MCFDRQSGCACVESKLVSQPALTTRIADLTTELKIIIKKFGNLLQPKRACERLKQVLSQLALVMTGDLGHL